MTRQRWERWAPVFIVASVGGSTALGMVTTQELWNTAPTEYDRTQWKHWIDDDGDCQDTRQEVLIRDSQEPVTFVDDRHCRVATGRWVCPYTGIVITDPSKVDVDHMVALKDAHDSGGWSWSSTRRQEFANNLEVTFQLQATSQYGNRSKGDRGPDQWLPPLESERCDYIDQWLRVKESWTLRESEGGSAVIFYMRKICADGLTPPLPQN